ncbi:MAG: AMP-binding protein, partial [Deltaproteobacteria bacterium]|nr:AMP-binding protein [Deltaproteobacteria bacterium]
TMLFGVPTMYHRLAEAIGTDPELGEVLRRARMTISGSAGLAARDARILRQHDIEVHQRYGLTETLINCAARFGEPIVDGTVGPALEGIELRIVSETRETLGPAQIGEVAVRGDNVFPGYLDDLEATAAVKDDDGWFYTGDVAEIDESGNVRIHGRKSTDLIKSGGYKIGAGEVEACLLEREEVKEVAVVGMPDDDLGERVVAFVVARNDAPIHEQSLIDHVARQLSPHKRPRQINVVAGLPRNAMGKVQKKRLLDG